MLGVLAYLMIPVLIVAIVASVTWARNRQPTSLQSGVESFRREMDALSPDATPVHRRRTDPTGIGSADAKAIGPPRRPPSSDRRS